MRTAKCRLNQWRIEGRIITICPEMAGGLPTPRPPAEIMGQGVTAALLTRHGIKVFNENQLQEVADYLKTVE